jgi:PAS domain S-box-containing protein
VIFRRTIANTILRNWVVGAFAAMLLVGGAWFRSEYEHFRTEEERIRVEILDARKAVLKEQVDRTLDLVGFMRSQTESRARESVRSAVQQAHATAAYIWQKHKGKYGDAEIQAMILDALRPIRFNRGRGYIFAFTTGGLQLLNADRPTLEGKMLLGRRDARGAYLFRDMAAIALGRGEGYYAYRWSKPNAPGNDFAKISFVKRFQPCEWVIGAGEYLDDADQEIREEVLARIGDAQFGVDGRMFAGTLDGTLLAGAVADPVADAMRGRDGAAVVRELVAKARSGGGFLTKAAVPEEGEIAPVIFYARAEERWGWFVAGGSGLGDIAARVEEARLRMMGRFWRTMAKIFVLQSLLFLGAVAVARYTASRMRSTFESFSAFFRKAATESAVIDPEGLVFTEFKELAESANGMIAERQRAEALAMRLAAAVEQAAEDIVITDPDGVIEYVNPSFEFTTGFTKEEAVGKTCRILNGGAQDAEFYKGMWDTIRSGERWKGRFRNRTRDGRLILQDANIAPITDASGAIAGYVSVRADITEHAEMEARLADSQRLEAIGTLAGGIAHDFNNILAAIVGYTEMALAGLPDKSNIREYLGQVLLGGKRATELVKQILAFSRSNAQEKRPVRIEDIVRETLKLLRAAVPSTVRIVPEIRTASRVFANPTQLYQVVMNLCTNASAAMGESGGTLRVRLCDARLDEAFTGRHPGVAPGEYVRMTVEDTGCGMAPEVMAHIFEPFFTTRVQGGGTGMGLAVVHGIVLAHGGAIDVASEPGRGSAFDIYLPVVPEPESERRPEESPPERGSESILFVDDEEAIRDLVCRRLDELGYRATGHVDSQAALAQFKASPGAFDLVISDVTMPGMTGDRLAQEILAIRPGIPIILCSGYTDRINEEEAIAMGIRAFIPKPVSFRTLVGTIRAALEHRTVV